MEKPKGQVFTPRWLADLMVEKLFKYKNPSPEAILLDPGCGYGVFIEAVLGWCKAKGVGAPRILGIELDTDLANVCRNKFNKHKNVYIIQGDFLLEDFEPVDYIICNPPYARLEELSKGERRLYRKMYETAVGRFDLYMLFFEKAIEMLKNGGRLVFIVPEKFEYTLSAASLRKLMTKYHVEELHHIREDAFRGLVTYPTIVTLRKIEVKNGATRVIMRSGARFLVKLPRNGTRWISIMRGKAEGGESITLTLRDLVKRISCGVATGEDKVFVLPKDGVPEELKDMVHSTVSGKDLTSEGIRISHVMVIPYDERGRLLPADKLKKFIRWAEKYRAILEERYCVKEGKRKWYEFHELPPMEDILKPKILCKDIAEEPCFWLDEEGGIIPRHSVYYIVPKDSFLLHKLYEYLNSEEAKKWIVAHAQRAANDFIRLQSKVLEKLPIPPELIGLKRLTGY